MFCSVVHTKAQKHFTPDSLKNHYQDKIQLWLGAGQSFPAYYTPNTYGFEIGHHYHSFGYIYSINAKWSILGNPVEVYKFQSFFYGWRVSEKHVSASLNVGIGQASFMHQSIKAVIGATSYNEYIQTKSPNFLIMCKMNLTARANGFGIIFTANLNKEQNVLEALFVYQLGFESTYKKRKK